MAPDAVSVQRVRLGIWISIGSNVAFAVADPLAMPELVAPLYAIKIATIAVLGAALVGLRRWPERWKELGWLGMSAISVGVGVSSVLTGQIGVTPLLLGVACIVAAALFGWGLAHQAGVVAVASAACVANGFASSAVSGFELWYAGFAFVVTAAVSLYLTHVLDRVRRERERREQMREDFTNMITHDIRNPLAVIQGFAEAILEDDGEQLSEDSRDGLRRIFGATRSAALLANNFLDSSRIDAGRLRAVLEEVAPVEIIRSVLDSQRPLAASRGILLEEAIEGPHDPVPLDANLLVRALTNLVDNAIKFTPRGGAVRVGARRAGGAVELLVEDTGKGLDEPPERLFERFARHGSRKDSTGLGLYIVREVARAHGGTVSARNRADGPGARFVLRLPVGAGPPARLSRRA